MDSRKRQTVTVSPAKPGHFPFLLNWQIRQSAKCGSEWLSLLHGKASRHVNFEARLIHTNQALMIARSVTRILDLR